MRHFRYYPIENYESSLCIDITARSKVRDIIKANVFIYYPYTIKDGERPDIIAHKYYGSANYTWMVLYANDIFDMTFDWPLSSQEFNSYITEKYGSISAAKLEIHHYENSDGLIIDETSYLADLSGSIIYSFEHEMTLNEAKRDIKLFDVSYRDQLVTEFRRIFK
jgi:hypothetical protein